MKNDSVQKYKLDFRERKLFKTIKEKSGLNTLELVKETEINKNIIKKYLDNLKDYNLIDVVELKQGEKKYFVKSYFPFPPFEESKTKAVENILYREQMIKKIIIHAKTKPEHVQIYAYRKCVNAIFSALDTLRFINACANEKPIKHHLEAEKKLLELLVEIIKDVDDRSFNSVLGDLFSQDNDNLDQLQYLYNFLHNPRLGSDVKKDTK